jgi:hypothetical protein
MNEPVDLYRYFDDAGRLLYVGISNSAFARAHAHRRRSSWWVSATSMTIEHHPTRERALAAEARAIQTERPIWNVALNGEQRRRLNRVRTYTLFEVAQCLDVKVHVLDQYLETGALSSSHDSGEFTDWDVERFIDRLCVLQPRRLRRLKARATLYRCCGVPHTAR